jgi:hypothetical protein
MMASLAKNRGEGGRPDRAARATRGFIESKALDGSINSLRSREKYLTKKNMKTGRPDSCLRRSQDPVDTEEITKKSRKSHVTNIIQPLAARFNLSHRIRKELGKQSSKLKIISIRGTF